MGAFSWKKALKKQQSRLEKRIQYHDKVVAKGKIVMEEKAQLEKCKKKLQKMKDGERI